MLSAKYRLRKNAQFKYAYRKGSSCANGLLTMVYVKSGPPASLRVGFSVSKKVGNSVVRNRTRRVLRAACRELIRHTRTGYLVIFIARKSAVGITYEQALRAQQDLLTRAGLYAAPERGR
ncbi:MAG: ribonuclease P protein component [Eubacteriales bacterium]|nr:ribonuclease P protein component [Eubacteriales bacterium]